MIYISNFNHAKTIADSNCYTLLHVYYVWAVVGLIGGHPSWTNMYLAMLSELPQNTVNCWDFEKMQEHNLWDKKTKQTT